MASTGSSPTVRSRRLGAELRKHRTAAGKTLDDAAEVLECHRSKISRMETGHLPVRRRDLAELLTLYGVTDADIVAHLTALTRERNRQNWWEDFGLDPAYANLLGLESDASYIRTFQSILIPGLLQTDEYTRAVVRANPGLASEEAVDTLLRVRDLRKELLTREENPVRFWAIIGEAAIRTPVGGAEVMQRQLEHLEKVTERANATVQVLPYKVGAHAGMSGPFLIFSFPLPADSDVVFLENLTSSLYLETAAEVDAYTLAFDALRSAALNPADSLALITEARQDLQSPRK